jgi:hypothetical protein
MRLGFRLIYLIAVTLAVWCPCLSGKTLVAARVSGTLVIDGKLDEPSWQSAQPCTDFLKHQTDAPSSAKTSVRVLYDENALYFGIRCEEPMVSQMINREAPRDGGLYQSDCVEVMLDPAISKERYYHFMVNALGNQYDAYRDQGGGVTYKNWNGSWTVKTSIEDQFWSTEIRIPFFNFAEKNPISGDWGINVCRGKRTNPREDSSLTGSYHTVDLFLRLSGIDTDLTSFQLEVQPPQGNMKLGEKERIFVENQSSVGNFSETMQALNADSWLTAPDGNVFTSASTRFEIKPGETRTITLPKIEVQQQGRYTNSLRVTDSRRRVLAYKEATQEIVFSPLRVALQVPWYRHCIFETQNIQQIEFQVLIGMEQAALQDKKLLVSIRDNEKSVWHSSVENVRPELQFSVDNASIPHGRYIIYAELQEQSGKKIDFCSAEFPLWKLPFRKTETWRGRDGNWYVEGNPIFINSFWSSKEFAIPEHNVRMYFKDTWKELPEGVLGLSGNPIFGVNKQPGVIKALQSGNLDEEYLELYRASVRKDLEANNLFAYNLADEPSSFSASPESLRQAYEAIKSADPYHPVFISDSSRNDYITACDINGHHPYPSVLRNVKANDCTSIATTFDSGMARLAGGYHQVTFIFMDMGFNKWDFGLGPADGRMATFNEFRDHMLMALACDMKGLIPFNSNYQSYPEGTIGFQVIAREGAWLGQAIIAPDTAFRPTADWDKLRFVCRDLDGDTVIIASNASMTPRLVTFTGLPETVHTIHVISEDRSIPVKNGSFSDQFNECQGHAYTTGTPPALESVDAVNQRIDEAWAKRARPGNFLFQRYKDDAVIITASDTFVNYSMAGAETVLWHLCDGYVPESSKGYGLLFWSSVINKLPAWIEFAPKKAPFELGCVEIDTLDHSLKEFTIEVRSGDTWKQVYENRDASATNHHVCRFPPENTSRFRINILSSNGDRARIGEVAAFAR